MFCRVSKSIIGLLYLACGALIPLSVGAQGRSDYEACNRVYRAQMGYLRRLQLSVSQYISGADSHCIGTLNFWAHNGWLP